MLKVWTQGITVDYADPLNDYPVVTVTYAVTETTRQPSIEDVAAALIMLGKMTDNEQAFEAEARRWLEEERDGREADTD